MKAALQFLVILSFVFVQNKSFSQSDLGFAPIGATWHYMIPAFNFLDPVTYVKYEVTGDTMINGKQASIVYRTHGFDVSNLPNPFFLHYDSNRVYWHNEHLNDFYLLYDFNANAGDSWLIRLPCDTSSPPNHFLDTIRYNVISTDSVIVNGIVLKRMVISSMWSASNTLVEKVGMLSEGYPNSTFFCGYGIADPSPWLMRCYEDSILGLFKGPDPDPCDTIYIKVDLEEKIQNKITFHPNPANQILRIESDRIIQKILVQSLTGTTLFRMDNNSNNFEIDVSEIPNGLYLISTVSSSGIRQTQKVIIQH